MTSPLSNYLQAERGRAAQVAAAIKRSRAFVSQMAAGKRPVPVRWVPVITSTTGLQPWQLRPDDWHEFWPHLKGAEGAPKVPQEAEPAA